MPGEGYFLGDIRGAYIIIGLVSAVYLTREFLEIRTVRAGMWTRTDLVIGGLMFFLVMEYARRRHFPLFVINLIMIAHTVYGSIVPGMFWHPGVSLSLGTLVLIGVMTGYWFLKQRKRDRTAGRESA